MVSLILSCMTYLLTLGINLLPVISFANIFFHSVTCLFILPMIYKLTSAISNIIQKTKTHTETYISPNRTRAPIALFSKLSYESDITVQNSKFQPVVGIRFFFFFFLSGFRDDLDKWSRELWSKGTEGVISSGQEFLMRFFFFFGQDFSGV